MKLKLEFDITPQEARKLIGLPDVEAMQEKLLDETYKKLSQGLSEMKAEKLFREFVPLGAQSLDQAQKIISGLVSLATRSGGDDGEDDDDKKT
jgi:hypothetical protein